MKPPMRSQTLYVRREPLPGRLTLGLLRPYLADAGPVWLSLEPRPWLPERDGKRQPGRLPGLTPLARGLPEGLDDLPLLAASLYAQDHWRHFHDAHPLSELPGQCLTWSLSDQEGAIATQTLCQRQRVLPWQDLQRFGLAQSDLPSSLETEHYYLNGKRLTWRLIPDAEASL